MEHDKIIVKGAKLHNLKDIDVEIPKGKLTVITGLSGSGKSTLAFDTIYAEGQRRYVESLSTYARNFLQLMEKPEVESIEGLSPAISIDQKTAPRNPRSTVGTVTEIYDFLRLLYAKIGVPHDPETGEVIERQTAQEILDLIANMEEGKKILLLAPVVQDRKGQHIKAIEKIKKEGFVRMRIDGEVHPITDIPELDENKKHNIEIVVDRLVVKDFKPKVQKLSSGQEISLPNPNRTRLGDSIEVALKYGEGNIYVLDHDTGDLQTYSEHYSSSSGKYNLPEITPRIFSFNSPHGACETCHGLGTKLEIDSSLVIPNKKLTLAEGAIMPWSATTSHLNWYNKVLKSVAKAHKFSMDVPVEKLSEDALNLILYGDKEQTYNISLGSGEGEESSSKEYERKFEGVIPNLERRYLETDSDYVRKKLEAYMRILKCPECEGKRLKKEYHRVRQRTL